MVIPQESSHEVIYGVIVGQESMRKLYLDTSIQVRRYLGGETNINGHKRLLVRRMDLWPKEQVNEAAPKTFFGTQVC